MGGGRAKNAVGQPCQASHELGLDGIVHPINLVCSELVHRAPNAVRQYVDHHMVLAGCQGANLVPHSPSHILGILVFASAICPARLSLHTRSATMACFFFTLST